MNSPTDLAGTRNLMLKTEDGELKACLANAATYLRCTSHWQGVPAFNSFKLESCTLKPAPWQREGAAWTDHDSSKLAEEMQHAGILVNSRIAGEAFEIVAHETDSHPIKNYLEGLRWDKKKRLETWLIDYAGAKDSEFVRAVSSRFLISAVARIRKPGCQCDHCLLLQGRQGSLKSSLLQALFGSEYFTDHISGFDHKDSRLELRGRWGIELSELNRIRTASLESVKSFLTSRTDTYRPPYGRSVIAVPRSCVFCATSNDETRLPIPPEIAASGLCPWAQSD
jgi:predicted P-loop ATPase